MSFKKILSVILATMMAAFSVAAFTGCQPSDEDVIRQTVADKFDAYKNGDGEAFAQISKIAEDEGLSDLGISSDEFANTVLEGFDYKINSIEVNGDSATANITITSKSTSDFMSKLDRAMNDFVGSDSTNKLSTDKKNEKIGELAMQAYKDAEIVNEDVALDFTLQGNTWTSDNAAQTLGQLDSLVFAN